MGWGGATALGLSGDVDGDVSSKRCTWTGWAPDGVRLDARARGRFRPVKEREDLAVAAHLSVHPLATEGELMAGPGGRAGQVAARDPVFRLHRERGQVGVGAARARTWWPLGKLHEAGADERARGWRARRRRSAPRCSRRLGRRLPGWSVLLRADGLSLGDAGEYRDAAGATVAMFLQYTSREGDPQLHVHMAVMNLAQRRTARTTKWRTLHSSMLFQERLAVAADAARELATRLTDLGYVLVPRADGNGFEVGAWTRRSWTRSAPGGRRSRPRWPAWRTSTGSGTGGSHPSGRCGRWPRR